MTAKLERTFLDFDVLRVEIRFGPQTTARLRDLAARSGREDGSPRAVADSLSRAALASENALVRVDLLRDVSLDDYLDAARENLEIASGGGHLSPRELETISRRIRPWFSFLEGRGLEEGDLLAYRVRGDTVRTVYRSGNGFLLLDQTDPRAPELRRAILASYLAEGIELREELLESLREDD